MTTSALLGDSYRWEVAQYPNSHLPRGRMLRAFKAVVGPISDPVSRKFVRLAARRALRRGILGVVASLVTGGLFAGQLIAGRMADAVSNAYDTKLDSFAKRAQVVDTIRVSVYAGLQAALDLSLSPNLKGSTVASSSIALGLDENLPVAAENPSNDPPSLAPSLADRTVTTSGSTSATYSAREAAITIVNQGGRTISSPVSGQLTAMAWTDDNEMLAYADGGGIQIRNVENGDVVDNLRGLDGKVDKIVWTGNSNIVGWAGSARATWTLPLANQISQSHSWYVALAPNADGSRMLALARDGTFRLIEGGVSAAPLTIPNVTRTIGVVWNGSEWLVALENGEHRGQIVGISERGEVGRAYDLDGDCISRSTAIVKSSMLLIACAGAFELQVLNLETGAIQHVSLTVQPISAVVDVDGAWLVASEVSEFIRSMDEGKTWTLVGTWKTNCAGGSLILLPSPNRTSLLTTGKGASQGCTLKRGNPSDRGVTYAVVIPRADMLNVRAAAWSPDGGLVVLGFDGGEIFAFGSTELDNRGTVRLGSEVRGLAFSPGGRTLVAVTRDGLIVQVSMERQLGPIENSIELARERLRIGAAAHLFA